MPTSKADRLNKLFEKDSLPSPPDPNSSHLADTEIISKILPAQRPWKVPKVAQIPRKMTRSPPRTGRDLDQLTGSDDDEYIRAFKKTPAMKPGPKAKANKTGPSTGYQQGGGPKAKVRTKSGHVPTTGGAGEGEDDGVSVVDKDGHPLIGRFCPLMLVTKFCYKYMDDPNDRVSRHFFASGKIWNRTWKIYYIHPPASLFSKPILLVPEIQVQALLDEINATFRTSIKLPRDPFLLAFYRDSTPAPTLLGTSQSRDAVAKMEQEITAASDEHGESPPDASPQLERSFLRFKEKMERAVAIQKKKSAAVKKSKAKDRLASQVNWCEALKRGQRYLGLRPVDRKGGLPLPDPSLSWDEQQRFEKEQKLKHGHILEPLDVEKPAPHLFDRDVVFISIDVEAFERAHNLITEIGISTLDTADIKLLPPGQGGVNWMECIRSRHFRVSNHSHLRNTTFCTGNPERFLFGHSEFFSMDEIGKMVDSCFKPPYSAGFTHDGKYRPLNHTNVSSLQIGDQIAGLALEEENLLSKDISKLRFSYPPADVQRAASAEEYPAKNAAGFETVAPSNVFKAASSMAEETPNNDRSQELPTTKDQHSKSRSKYRNIILIGHDIDSDLQYLSMLKSGVFHKPPAVTYPQPLEPEDLPRQHILERLDTANLYQVWKRETNITSLAKVLVGVERTGWDLHNGGNDARYTMEAMIGILIRSRIQEDEVSKATPGDGFAQNDTAKPQTWEEEAEEKLTQSIREKQEAVEREERENAAMWSHAMGSYGERDALTMPDPYQSHPQDISQPTDRPVDTMPFHHPPAADSTTTQPPYPWSSSPRATRDGGKPKGFAMPTPKPKGARVSSSSRRRDEVEKLRDEGVIGGPCDWGVGGEDGW